MKAVFYAWQSDLPNKTNRGFIESCLERAIEQANLRRPANDRLFLDQGTEGVSGMPDISQVIFDKIDTCAVFVPDLSITSRSSSGKGAPNANVLIELGYALRAIGDRRVVGVFNEAVAPKDDLPFDLKSHRYPACYVLEEGASTEEKQRVRDELVKLLAHQIAAAAARADRDESGDDGAASAEASGFDAYDLHGRFKNGQVIAHVDAATPAVDADGRVLWRSAPQATIELRPKVEKATESYVKLHDRALNVSFSLRAFGPRGTQWNSRNVYGFIVGDLVSTPIQPRALCVTQLYKNSGAIYGVNQALMAEDSERRFILADRVRIEFEETLANYLSFYRANPDLGDSFSLYATFQQVGGLFLRTEKAKDTRFVGPIVENLIYHALDTISLDVDVVAALRPLFEKVWDNAGTRYEEKS